MNCKKNVEFKQNRLRVDYSAIRVRLKVVYGYFCGKMSVLTMAGGKLQVPEVSFQ